MSKSKPKRNGPESKAKKGSLSDLISFIAFVLAVAAIIKELRTPAADRTWTGVIAGAVPYDFRKPTLDRAKERVWNPEGPVFSPQVFGVGWTLNFGAVLAKLRK